MTTTNTKNTTKHRNKNRNTPTEHTTNNNNQNRNTRQPNCASGKGNGQPFINGNNNNII